MQLQCYLGVLKASEFSSIVENQFVCHKVIDGIPYFNLFPKLEAITKDYNYANKTTTVRSKCSSAPFAMPNLHIPPTL